MACGAGRPAQLHRSMCKKIAQLTKDYVLAVSLVLIGYLLIPFTIPHPQRNTPEELQQIRVIYALNTKNDEHEANIQALKDAHEEEIQHIHAETRKTILQYKSKAEEEESLRKRIQVLEDAVDQQKRLKEEALAELTLFKKQVKEKELRFEVKQAEILSTNTGDANADFENRLLHLNQQHEGLLNECKALREIFDTKEILDEKHSVEEQALINKMENLSENQRVTEECTQKSSQLQDFCEREKETLQQAIQQSMAEQQKNCQQRELEPRKSLEAQEVFLLQQVKKLEVDLEEKTWKVNERKKHSQKMKERIQVAQLKQMLEQQASNFKESLKKQDLQAIKEKEKLLQDLQNTIKENQNVKLQLEASHQKILKMLEKSKNRELKEAEERLKREFNETFKTQHQSHKLEIQTLEERAKKELHDELEQIQKEQTLLLGSVRLELSEQQALCTSLRKQIADLQEELHRVRTLRKHQEGSSQSQLRSLHDELQKSQHEVSGLKKENLLLKDTMELLSAELGSQKQEAAQLQDREKQHRRLLIEDLQAKHSKELDALKQDHQKEMENMLCDFSSTQAHLQAKIFSLETELKGLEEKSRKQEARAEDKHLVSCLQDKIREREEIIKQLVEGRKFQHSLLANTECYRSRSFSFNPNRGCLTPSMKEQKKAAAGPSRVISVPNLASYAKSFLGCERRPRGSAPQAPKWSSLEQSCLASRAATRAHDSEVLQNKGDQSRSPQHQEWFAKYFSF